MAGEETSTPLPDIRHDVRKLPNGRVKIGKLSYRDCAATGAGGNGEAVAEDPGGNHTAFAEHETTPLNGRFKMPSFAGDPDHAHYKTRLVDAANEGVNFGGHFALTQIGCGTQCNFAMAVNGNTGQVIDFPIGGEDYLEMSLAFRPDSSLVKAYWNPDEKGHPTCEYADFVQEGSSFRRLPNDGNPRSSRPQGSVPPPRRSGLTSRRP